MAEAGRHPRREARVHARPDRPGPHAARDRARSTRSAAARSISRSPRWRARGGSTSPTTTALDEAARRSPASSRRGTRRSRTLEDGAAAAPNGELAAGAVGARRRDPRGAARRPRARDRCVAQGRARRGPTICVALAALDRLLALEGRVARAGQGRRASRRAHRGRRRAPRAAPPGRRALRRGPRGPAEGDRARTRTCSASTTPTSRRSTRSSGCTARRDRGDAMRRASWSQTLERKIELTTRRRRRARSCATRRRRSTSTSSTTSIRRSASSPRSSTTTRAIAGALAELDRIYAKQKLWPELLDVGRQARAARDERARPRRPRVPRRAARRGRADRSRRGDPALRRRAPGAAGARRRARRRSRR